MFFDNLIFLKVFRKFIEFEERLTFFHNFFHNSTFYTTILKIIYFCQNQYKCSLSHLLQRCFSILFYIYLKLYISRINIDKSRAKQFKAYLIELVSTLRYIRESQRTANEKFFGASSLVCAATIEIKF